MPMPAEPEKTRQHRPRVLKGGSILSGINNSAINCTLRNMHKGGAELRVPVGVPIPQEFLLYVPVDGVGYRSIVRWRKQDRIGVEFNGTEAKPGWFYG